MVKKNKTKKPEVPDRHFASDDGNVCVYEVYKKSNKAIYYFRDSRYLKYTDKLTLQGYADLPAGLYLNKKGYGFGKKGILLLIALKEQLAPRKNLEVVIIRKGKKSISTNRTNVVVVLPCDDVRNLLVKLARINEESNLELKEAVGSFLSTKFPTRIKLSTENFDEYKGGEVAALLRRTKVTEKLNEEDLDSLQNFFPKIFASSLKGKRKGVKKLRSGLIQKTKRVTDQIFLDEVIKEFEKNLSNASFSENSWQEFLRDKVLRYMSNYVTSIEKQNASIEVSYPDFVMVDVYGFVDVFEIKKHTTPLLSYDSDHENYYWKPDVSMAVAQIEKYIDEIVKNSDAYIRAVKKKKGVDIQVVRPRGYIIAGASSQFKNKIERDDFRKLGMSLKNINFILYDELLENLKNLRSKI
ncbi:MAG: Shedu immune nuclease family protein [Nanoarchaeota archaeon]|mgnify:CR=1 FL=1